ncbi:MAG: hypothetical protein IJQ32_08945 [Paludibacteraceae bacterium]|nr:hypothetical protein [Paludibacteraceae bacterium]
MKRILFSIMLVSVTALCMAGEVVRVSAVYEYVSDNPNETPVQAESNAFAAAKQKALEDKFGLDVTKITNTLMTNRTEGSVSKSETNVFSVGETAVRGEWIETIEEKVLEKSFAKGFWGIKVRVVGKARNYSTEKADIQYMFCQGCAGYGYACRFQGWQ